MRKLLLLCSYLAAISLYGQGTIITSPPLTPNNGSTGISLRVEATSPIEITGLTNVFSTGATSATVWVRQGGVTPGGTPNVSTANGWTQVVVNAPITGANSTALNNIPFGGVKIPVPSGGSIGIFIEGTSGSSRYQTGTASDQVIFTDGTMTVNLADSVAYGGPASSPSNNPRRFVGSVTYALSVTGNCTPFTGFAIDSISGTAAKVNWTPGTGNTGYKLEYGPVGFTPGTGTVVSGTYPTSPVSPPVILSGLSASTTYDVYFEEYCNTGTDTVGFPTPQSFTTTKLCGAPTGFAESNLTSNTVDVNWSQAGSYTEAWVMWGPTGTTPGSAGWDVDTIMSPTMTYTISGLSPSTGYDIYLATNCGGGNGVSDTVGPIQIVTPIQGPQGLNCTTGQAGLIFQDDFETQLGWTGNFGSGTTASNWNYHSGPTGSTATGPTGAHSGNTYLYTEVSGTASGTHIEAISPRIDLSSSFNHAELAFWLHAYGANIDTIKVQVGGSATGPWNTVFTRVGQVQTANADPWQQVGVNLDAYVGSAIYLRFLTVHGTSFNGDVSIDLVEVSSCQTCPFPSAPTVNYVSSDSAYFTWNGTGYDYDVNWGPRGFTQGSPSSFFDSTSVASIGIGGLSGNTAYDIYIRNDCSDSANGTSGWVGPVPFVTLCNPLTAPYTNNFDSDSIDAPPICWDNALIGGTSATLPNADVEVPSTTYPPISSPNVVRFYNYNTDTAWLISPQFSDLSVGDKRISFYAMTTTTATPNQLVVGTVASPGDRSSYVAIDTIDIQRNYAQYVVDLTVANGYNGSHEFVVLEHAGPDFRTYYIDDFVYEQIPACNPPLSSTLGVNYVTATTAEVFWGSGSDGDTTWIEWGLPGFTPGASNLGRIAVSGAQDSALISGLMAETDYEFYIQDSCYGNGNSPYVGPVAFRTACAIVAPAVLPLSDGFENYSNGPTFSATAFLCNPSYYWTFEPGNTNGRGRLQANSAFYRNGLQAFTIDNSAFVNPSQTSYLTMTVDLSSYTSAGGINLSFYLMDHSNQNHPDNKVWVRGAPSDPWIEVVDLNTTVFGSFGSYDSIIDLDIMAPITSAGQAIGNSTQIRWGQNDFGSATSATCCYGYTIDDVSLTAVTCPNPSALAVSNLLDTTATMGWANSTSASQYQFWFGPQGFYQGTTTTTGTKFFTSSSSITADTLSATTCYEFLVRSVCSAGDTSDWVGPVQFCTTCPVGYAMPYFTDFEINTPGVATGSPAGWANCWTQQSASGATVRWEAEDASGSNENSSSTGPFLDNTLAPQSGGIYMYLETSTSGSYADLVSPGINLAGSTNPQIEFAYHMYGATINKLVILAENVTTGTITTLDSIVGQQQTAGSDPFNTHVTNVSSLASGSYRFIFRGYLGTSFTGDISIDDVWVMEAPTCPRPAGLMQDSANLNDITASWTSNGTGSSWEIEYGPAGFTPGSGTTIIATSNPYTITGLSSATAYDVYVREICGPGDTSLRVGPSLMNTTLCLASDQCWHDVDLEDTFGDGWNGGLVDVVQNGVVVATLGQSFTTGTLYQDSVLLCDLLNTVFVLQNAGGWPSEIGITVYTPWGTQAGQYIANGATGQGDTLVAMTAQCNPPTCPQPTALVVNSVTGTTANVGWTAGGTGTSWEVEYSTGTFLPGAGTRVSATTNPYTITGLSGSTNYNFYVREVCSPGDTSVWSGPMNFATACITATAPYFTDFENIPIGTGTGTPATWGNCWYAETLNGATVRWESEDATGANENSLDTGPFTDASIHPASGGTYMYIETSTSGTGPAELTSPTIDFSSLSQPELRFAYHMYGATINKLVIQAEDINGNRIAIDSLVGQQQTAQSDSFFIRTIDLSTLPQTTYAFVFQGYRGTSFTGDISIDDVSVDEQGSTGSNCPAPLNAMATTNVGCDSVEVDWMSGTGGSIIEYGPAGFTPGTGTFTNVVTAPYTIYGLTPGTAYDILVADTCSGDTSSYAPINVSTASGPLPVATIGSVTSTIAGNQFIVYLDATGTTDATSYTWDFGNGVTGSGLMDTVVFLGNGTYTVVLTATNGCGSDTASYQVYVNIGLDENPLANHLNVYPNPANYKVNVSFREVGSADVEIRLRDAQGREVLFISDRMQSGTYARDIDVSQLARGIYTVEVKSGGLTAHRRLSLN
ncbi:fibronectin type III domain-containing protein [Croceimicrobium hydrocarbonivorans]|uniref:Fibronectin type III domain-containing protein n=1 Tax=Croceimicrobium hydrocarbonivorans TaxID=2761580 RepID=A0A7H0VCW8_9FLAO|nr:fibronectin type III domain-containing protein [Croceimicrobium hydrocarbonivorans]QNR23566.1 fibronectin type III domain-containing protein [Croceimicrobium hydrocarbonivorans]